MRTYGKKLVSAVLIGVMCSLPIKTRSDEPPPPPPKSEWAVVVCAVIGVGLVATGIYLLNKKCQPKYYWLMDDSESPPRTWVGTCTDKQCKIEGWKKIGGPYDRPGDAPPTHPPYTNRVNEVSGPVMNHAVEQSTDGQSWTTIHQEQSTQEDFSYFVPATNTAAFFRLRVGP